MAPFLLQARARAKADIFFFGGKPAAHRDVSRPSSIIKEEANSFRTPFRSIESPCPAGMEWHPATDTRPRRCMDVDECKDDSSLSTQVSLNDCNGNNFLNTQCEVLAMQASSAEFAGIRTCYQLVQVVASKDNGSSSSDAFGDDLARIYRVLNLDCAEMGCEGSSDGGGGGGGGSSSNDAALPPPPPQIAQHDDNFDSSVKTPPVLPRRCRSSPAAYVSRNGGHSCHYHASCRNTVGAYTCECNAGYVAVGGNGTGKRGSNCTAASPLSSLELLEREQQQQQQQQRARRETTSGPPDTTTPTQGGAFDTTTTSFEPITTTPTTTQGFASSSSAAPQTTTPTSTSTTPTTTPTPTTTTTATTTETTTTATSTGTTSPTTTTLTTTATITDYVGTFACIVTGGIGMLTGANTAASTCTAQASALAKVLAVCPGSHTGVITCATQLGVTDVLNNFEDGEANAATCGATADALTNAILQFRGPGDERADEEAAVICVGSGLTATSETCEAIVNTMNEITVTFLAGGFQDCTGTTPTTSGTTSPTTSTSPSTTETTTSVTSTPTTSTSQTTSATSTPSTTTTGTTSPTTTTLTSTPTTTTSATSSQTTSVTTTTTPTTTVTTSLTTSTSATSTPTTTTTATSSQTSTPTTTTTQTTTVTTSATTTTSVTTSPTTSATTTTTLTTTTTATTTPTTTAILPDIGCEIFEASIGYLYVISGRCSSQSRVLHRILDRCPTEYAGTVGCGEQSGIADVFGNYDGGVLAGDTCGDTASAFTNAVNEFAGPAVTLDGLACDDASHFFIDPEECEVFAGYVNEMLAAFSENPRGFADCEVTTPTSSATSTETTTTMTSTLTTTPTTTTTATRSQTTTPTTTTTQTTSPTTTTTQTTTETTTTRTTSATTTEFFGTFQCKVSGDIGLLRTTTGDYTTCERQVAVLNMVLETCPIDYGGVVGCKTQLGIESVLNNMEEGQASLSACGDLADAIAHAITEYRGPAGDDGTVTCVGSALTSPPDECEAAAETLNDLTEDFIRGGFQNCEVTTPTTTGTTSPTTSTTATTSPTSTTITSTPTTSPTTTTTVTSTPTTTT
eukprot:gene5849-898_t